MFGNFTPPGSRPARTRARRRVALQIAALGSAGAMLLAACGGSSTKAGSSSKTTTASDSLVVASAGLPSTFTIDGSAPAGYENLEFGVNTQLGLLRQPYEADSKSGGLVQDGYHFQPALASSYDVSADSLTYTFHLRTDVKSVAGDPLTADDVIWSFQRKFKAATAITKYVQDPVVTDPDTQLKKIDDSTVAFTVTKPGYGFTLLSLLANVTGYIYDSTLLKKHVTSADPYAVTWSQNNPNDGFGAYQRTSFTPGTSMVLTANPNYNLGAPFYKKVTFRVSNDPGTRANAVKNGDADIAVQLRAADQKSLATTKGVKVYTFPLTNMMTMLTMDTTKAPFNDVRVRQAMSYAVPYQQILDNVYYGRGILTKGLFDPTAPNYNSTGLKTPTYDPVKAKQLLAAAGHPGGISYTITVSSSVPDVQQAAVQVQSYAAKAGFNIQISQQPAAAVSEGITSRKWPAFMWRDMAISSSPQYELGLFFKKAANKAADTNSSGWISDEYISDVDQGAALPDATSVAANKFWNAAEQITTEQVPQIYIGRIQPQNAFRSTITGYANRLDNDIDFSMLKAGGS